MVANKIIVPLDGSPHAERALPVARAIARRNGSGLILVTVRDDGSDVPEMAYLERLQSEPGDIPTEVMLLDDHSAAHAIEQVASDQPDRIVCMTSHGRGALRWALLGSVAEEVLRHSRRPILLVGRHVGIDWADDMHHMMVCVGGGSAVEPVVPVAAEWAKALGLDVRVTQVIHPLDVESATHPNPVLETLADQFALRGVHAEPSVLRGSFVAGAIAEVAAEWPASFIAMNTHARAGAARVALGSVAMATVGRATCPVLLTPLA